MCAGGFELILQVASTLWSDIKSQKLSEHGFSLKWIKCSPRPTKLGKGGIGQPVGRSWGWLAHLAGRPTHRSADLAHGPHRLILDTWRLFNSCLGRF